MKRKLLSFINTNPYLGARKSILTFTQFLLLLSCTLFPSQIHISGGAEIVEIKDTVLIVTKSEIDVPNPKERNATIQETVKNKIAASKPAKKYTTKKSDSTLVIKSTSSNSDFFSVSRENTIKAITNTIGSVKKHAILDKNDFNILKFHYLEAVQYFHQNKDSRLSRVTKLQCRPPPELCCVT